MPWNVRSDQMSTDTFFTENIYLRHFCVVRDHGQGRNRDTAVNVQYSVDTECYCPDMTGQKSAWIKYMTTRPRSKQQSTML